MAARLEKEAALANEGVVDRYKDHRLRPLGEHLEDYRRFLLAKGNTAEYVDLVVARAKAVVEGCKFSFWGDISASRVVEYLAELRVGVPVTRLAKWKTTGQMVAVGFLIAGEAGDRVLSTITKINIPVVTEIGILLLWLSAILTLYTGWDYMRAGLQYMVDE